MSEAELVKPSLRELPQYREALEAGWSPDNVRKAEAAQEELAHISADPLRFLAGQDDLEAAGSPIQLLDGSTMLRLPSMRRWVWDGTFCGSISLR